MNWFLHACPACGGDLYEERDDKGWVTCLQCNRTFRLRRADTAQRRTLFSGALPGRRNGLLFPKGPVALKRAA